MVENKKINVPKSFWIISIVILIWHIMGLFHFIDYLTTSVDKLVSQGMTLEQAEFFLRGPSYIGAIFGLGVISGLLGAIFLISRKVFAPHFFLTSAILTLISFIIDGIDGGFSILGPIYLSILSFTLVVGFLEFWYSRNVKIKGILN